ncbi:MAG: endonuclease/exonuclease/phosphatase family protein [Pyrinomonadaceae bacterium]
MRTTIAALLLVCFVTCPWETRIKAASHSAPNTILRVMTYNIHVGVGMDTKLDLQRIADVIKNERPDFVGLQEVDRGVKRTEGKDEIAELAQLTKMQFAFGYNLAYQGGRYGVAILSRYPIDKIEHRLYENKHGAERRGMLRIEVNIAGHNISFVTTHLDYQYEDGREFETQQLLNFLADVHGPIIVSGDFNEEPTGAAYTLMSAAFADGWLLTNGQGFSYPADQPLKRIDYIFYRPSRRLRGRSMHTVSTLASDHLPVVAELELR